MRVHPRDLAPSERPTPENDVDVFGFLGSFARHWKMVAGLGALAVLVAVAATLLLGVTSPGYQAQATVLLTGARYRLQLDPKFTTVDTLTSAVATRADEFQVVAAAPEVRGAAAERMRAATGSAELGAVDVRARGNILTISATSADPNRAVASANAFAEAAASRLDTIFGLGEADQASLKRQLSAAVADDDAAEARLAEFTRTDRAGTLSREILQRETALDTLAGQQSSLVRSRLATYYQALDELERIRRDADALRLQLREASRSSASLAGQSLALLNLQTRLAAVASGRPSELSAEGSSVRTPNANARADVTGGSTAPNSRPQLQISLDVLLGKTPDPQLMIADLDAIVDQVNRRQSSLREEFAKSAADIARRVNNAGQNLATGDDASGALEARLNADVLRLRAELQDQEYRRGVLQGDVALARTARTTLETKLREATIAGATTGGKAVVASQATAAARVFPPPLGRTIGLAALLGLIIGAMGALTMDRLQAQRASRDL